MAHSAQKPFARAPDGAQARAALFHFAELVAAEAGYGLEVDQPDQERDADRELLAEVTATVLRHLAKQRARQRDAAYGSLVSALAEDYARLRDGEIASECELRCSIVAMCLELGFSPTPTELDALAMPLEADAVAPDGRPLSIKEAGGPIEAAKLALATVVDRSVGTLVTARRRANAVLIGRRAFGRLVSKSVAIAFLDDLVREWVGQSREGPAPSMQALHDVGDVSGEALDKFVKTQAALLATPQGLRTLFNSPPRGPYSRQFRQQLIDAHAGYESAVLAVISTLEVLPILAEARLAKLPHIGDVVRTAAGVLLRARISSDAQAVAAATKLSDAIWNELFEKSALASRAKSSTVPKKPFRVFRL